MPPGRVGEIVLFVPDVELAARFYEHVFELSRRFYRGVSAEDVVVLECGGVRISFQSRSMSARHGGEKVYRLRAEEPPPPFELAFDVEDVDGTFARAVAAGGEPLEHPHDTAWGDRIAHVRDPNGLLIGLSLPHR